MTEHYKVFSLEEVHEIQEEGDLPIAEKLDPTKASDPVTPIGWGWEQMDRNKKYDTYYPIEWESEEDVLLDLA